MRSFSERTVKAPGLTLAAREWGDPTAPHKVLALHGWLDNCATFDGLAPLLAGIHLVAIDFPGHGRSEHRSINATYHFIDWIPDVVAVADDLGWDRFTMMGHSMGAAVASITAGTVPERVRGVVLLDGLAPFTTPAEEVPETLASYIRQRTRLLEKERPLYPSRDAATDRLLKVTNLTREAAATLVERNTVETAEGVAWTYDGRLRRISPMRFTDEHNRAFLRSIKAPVLFVRPTSGIRVDATVLAAWLGDIANLTQVSPAGGHHVHLEYPDRIAPAVQAFLQQLPE